MCGVFECVRTSTLGGNNTKNTQFILICCLFFSSSSIMIALRTGRFGETQPKPIRARIRHLLFVTSMPPWPRRLRKPRVWKPTDDLQRCSLQLMVSCVELLVSQQSRNKAQQPREQTRTSSADSFQMHHSRAITRNDRELSLLKSLN